MKRCFALAFLVVAGAAASGCAMCCSPYDDAYSAYGGKWQRADMYNGRVGSAFHPAQGGVSGEVVYEGGMAQSGGEMIYEGSPQGDSYEYYDDSVPTPPPSNRTSPFQEEARRQSGTRR